MAILNKINEKQRYLKTRTSGDGSIPVVASDLNPVIDAVNALSGNATPAKKYVALITQSEGAEPTQIILENTLGGTIVWTRSAAGSYIGTLTGAFPANNTFCLSQADGNAPYVFFGQNDANSVYLQSSNVNTLILADSLLTKTSIEIRVYP